MRHGIAVITCVGLAAAGTAQNRPDPRDPAVIGLPLDGYYHGETSCANGPLTIRLSVENRTTGYVQVFPPSYGVKYSVGLVKSDLEHFTIEPVGRLEATAYIIRKYAVTAHKFYVTNIGDDVVAVSDDASCRPFLLTRTANYQLDPRSLALLPEALAKLYEGKPRRYCPSRQYYPARGGLPGELDCSGGWRYLQD